MNQKDSTPREKGCIKSNPEFAALFESSIKATGNAQQEKEPQIELNFLCKNNSNIAKTIEDLEKHLHRSKNNDSLLEDANNQMENLIVILNSYKNSKNALSIHYSRQAEKIRLYAKKLSDKVTKFSEGFIKEFYKGYKDNLKDLEKMISEISILKNKTELIISNIKKSPMMATVDELNKITSTKNQVSEQSLKLKRFEEPINIDLNTIFLKNENIQNTIKNNLTENNDENESKKTTFELDTILKQFFSSNEYYNLDLIKPKSQMISIRNSLDIDQQERNTLRSSIQNLNKFSRENSIPKEKKNIPEIPRKSKLDNKILVQSELVESPVFLRKYNTSANKLENKNSTNNLKANIISPPKVEKENNSAFKDRRIFSREFDSSNSKSTNINVLADKLDNLEENNIITNTNLRTILSVTKCSKQSTHLNKTTRYEKKTPGVFASYDPTLLVQQSAAEKELLEEIKFEKKMVGQIGKEQLLKNLEHKTENLNSASKDLLRKSVNNRKNINSSSRVKNYSTMKQREKIQTCRNIPSNNKKNAVMNTVFNNTNQKKNIFGQNSESTVKKKTGEIFATTNYNSKGYNNIQRTNTNIINSQTILDKVYNDERMTAGKQDIKRQKLQVTNKEPQQTDRPFTKVDHKYDSYTFTSSSNHRPYFVKNINEFCKKFSTSSKRNIEPGSVSNNPGSEKRIIKIQQENNMLAQSAHNFMQSPENLKIFTTSPEQNYDNQDQFGLISSIEKEDTKATIHTIKHPMSIELGGYSRNAISEACSPNMTKRIQLERKENVKVEKGLVNKTNNLSLNNRLSFPQRNSFKEVNSPEMNKKNSDDTNGKRRSYFSPEENKMDKLFNEIKESNTPLNKKYFFYN